MSIRKRRESKKMEQEQLSGDGIYEAGSQILKSCKFENNSAYWDVVFDYGMRMSKMKKKNVIKLDFSDKFAIEIVEGLAPLLGRYATYNSDLNQMIVTYDREAYIKIYC